MTGTGMADLVNLKRFKKRQEREQSAKQADANRARFGRSKAQRSLEEAFWNGMKESSGLRNMTLSELVGEIDNNRQQGNLSSAIRLFVLDYFRTRAMPAAAPDARPQA